MLAKDTPFEPIDRRNKELSLLEVLPNLRPLQGPKLFHYRTANFEDFRKFLEKFGHLAATTLACGEKANHARATLGRCHIVSEKFER